MSTLKIYTFGYQGQQVAALAAEVERVQGVVVDVRYSPYSRNQQWAKKRLQVSFPDRYIHLQELGNLHYKANKPIKIADMVTGAAKVGAIVAAGFAPILLCVCKDVRHCHRLVVGRELVRRGLAAELVHLPEPALVMRQGRLL